MQIHLPSELEPFEAELHFFFTIMVRKLHMNRHKGFAEGLKPKVVLEMLWDEIFELEEASTRSDQFGSIVEAADIANFAFILSLYFMRATKAQIMNDNKIDEVK